MDRLANFWMTIVLLERGGRELDLLRSILYGIDGSCMGFRLHGIQIRRLLQEWLFPRCEKFGTWFTSEERVDRVPNRKVSQELMESSVLGDHKRSVSRQSWTGKYDSPTVSVLLPQRDWRERVDRALNRKASRRNCSEQQAPLSP